MEWSAVRTHRARAGRCQDERKRQRHAVGRSIELQQQQQHPEAAVSVFVVVRCAHHLTRQDAGYIVLCML